MDHKRETISHKIVDTYIMPDLLANDSVSNMIHRIYAHAYIKTTEVLQQYISRCERGVGTEQEPF